MIGGDQMFAPVLDPFNRSFEFQGGRANEHILGIHFAANAEAAADMALVELHLVRLAAKHERQPVAVPVRHLRGAMHFKDVVGFIVPRNGTAGFHRHAAVPADFEIKRHDHLRRAKSCINVAGLLFDHRGFGVMAFIERAKRSGGIENDRQRLDVDLDEIGRILGNIWIGSEDSRYRLPDITHVTLRQRGLLVGLKLHEPGQAKSDRRNVSYIVMGPDGVHAGQGKSGFCIDCFQ